MTAIAAARATPRQLDIIADTALAVDPRLKHGASSSVRPETVKPAVHGASSSVKSSLVKPAMHRASSSVDPRIAAIDSRRAMAGLRHAELCRRAGIEAKNWSKLRRGDQRPADRTISKLLAALEGRPATKPPQVIIAFHCLVMQLLAVEMSVDRDAVLDADFSVQRPSNPQWLQAARIRQMAIYITAVELEVSNADLGRALGVTRANVKFARDAIEDRREDGNEIDLALTAVRLRTRKRAG